MFQKLKQIRGTVLAELNHIPKGSQPQGALRMLYWSLRMHSLGRKVRLKKTATEVLIESIELLKADYPDFEFQYDEEFFSVSKED